METIQNLIGFLFFGVLGLVCLIVVLFCGAWWHIITAVICISLSRTFYVDNDYNVESVKHYLHRILKF